MTSAATLRSLADTYWETHLEGHPLTATMLGDRRFDDRLADITPAGRAARRARLDTVRTAVEAIDPGDLDATDRVTRAALLVQLDGDIGTLDADLETFTVDPIEGPQVEFPSLETYQVVSTPADARSMVARWRAMAPYLAAEIENLALGLAAGRVAAEPVVRRVIAELDDLLATPIERWALLSPSRPARPTWPAGERDGFVRDLGAAVRDSVRPMFARYRRFLADEVLPAARPADRAGLWALPGGPEAYRALIRASTSLDLPPETLHETGLREIERLDLEFVELGGRVLGARDLGETLARLRGDAALYFGSRDEILEAAERAVRRATAALPDAFGTLPGAGCEVLPMGVHEEKHSTAGYYRDPAVDGSRPGQYFVNTYDPRSRPRYEAEALAYHEAVPGHHLQVAIAQEIADLPAFRRFLGVTAFVEGWALHAERLADELDLYSSDLDRFGIVSFDAWRACRLVVDTGIHALGWPREQAIAFMTEHTALADDTIANEVDRYIAWPGQALAYKTGQLELRRLREETEARLGPAFDRRAFNDTILRHGALPLSTLREQVEQELAAPVASG